MRQRDWEKEKAIHILELVRSELYMDMPHFLTALNTLMFKEDEHVSVCATNGVYFYYNPLKVIELFQKNSIFLNRAYLHSYVSKHDLKRSNSFEKAQSPSMDYNKNKLHL